MTPWRGVVEGLPCGLEEELLAGVLLQLLHGLELLDLFEVILAGFGSENQMPDRPRPGNESQ